LRVLPLICALICALGALSGCAIFGDAPHYRGIAVTPQELSQLTPGVSTKADAEALIGPPTFQEQFGPNNWVYVSQVTKMRIARTEGVNQQHVVVLSFNQDGTLKDVTQKDLKQGVRVAMDGAKTPVPGGSAGFIQQLIGGVGAYSPLGITGGNTTPGGFGGVGGAGGGSGL
jgi:outer membrane protein assembly factor BamE (lipoprotein component of BamABCDE complex)